MRASMRSVRKPDSFGMVWRHPLRFVPLSTSDFTRRTHRFSGLTGAHWVEAILAAVTTALALGIDAHSAADLLETFVPLPGRSRLLNGVEGSLVLDDTHNAPPAAVEAALETIGVLQSLAPRSFSIAVLGDMLRLGNYEPEAHHRVGKAVVQVADHLVTHGPRAESLPRKRARAGCVQSLSILPTAQRMPRRWSGSAWKGWPRPERRLWSSSKARKRCAWSA